MSPDPVTMDKIVSLCKRRGIIFPSSEIYGGIGSSYDYGHYGVLLKNNVKAQWWRALLQQRAPPLALDVVLEQYAVMPVVVARSDAAVDLARGQNEAAPLAQRDDLVHRDDVGCHWRRMLATPPGKPLLRRALALSVRECQRAVEPKSYS